MPRPPKPRVVCHSPEAVYFKPRGVPLCDLEEVVLGLDETEALRLADLEGYSQEEVGEQMQVSRATVGRILEAAHRKVAEALVDCRQQIADVVARRIDAERLLVQRDGFCVEGIAGEERGGRQIRVDRTFLVVEPERDFGDLEMQRGIVGVQPGEPLVASERTSVVGTADVVEGHAQELVANSFCVVLQGLLPSGLDLASFRPPEELA